MAQFASLACSSYFLPIHILETYANPLTMYLCNLYAAMSNVREPRASGVEFKRHGPDAEVKWLKPKETGILPKCDAKQNERFTRVGSCNLVALEE